MAKAAKKPTKEVEVAAEVVAAETVEAVQEEEVKTPKPIAKAGKRSAKAIKEAEAEVAKEERKAAAKAAEELEGEKPKQPVKPTRTRLERQGKKFRKAAEQVDKKKVYSLAEALELATKTSTTKFDATVELHVNLSVDPRQADQNVRDNLVLPAGTGKTVRVAAFADDAEGADLSGIDEILKQLEKGVIDFDILVASPANMPKLGKYARVLGPRGLMPNPKSGTVTNDIAKAVREAKAGRVEYRVDTAGIVHMGIGKVSFGKDKLVENATAVFASIKSSKPNSVKGVYIKSAYVATTMGPSMAIAINEL